MNTKSIDKMKGLLKNARDTSVWWKENKKSAEKYASVGKVLTLTVAYLSVFIALGGFLWVVSSASVLIGFFKSVTFLAGWFGLVYMSKGLLKKINNQVAKKFKEGHKLCGFDYMDEIQWDKNEDVIDEVLRTARSIPLSDVHNLCPHLEKLRNASLPLSWWRQMKWALDKIEIPKDSVFVDKSNELLEQVYAAMSEKNIDTNAQPRVLKL